MKYQIINGNNIDVLKTFPDNHFDSIVTDPPYGIDFLGKAWDANTGALETYQECLRVLKPGGHILAFSAARTYHHLAITLEQAGFEIRDQIMWIYSSGFPKSQDVGRQIQKSIYGKPDKQRFDPAIMIKVDGDKYKHPDNNKVYRKLPDINGDRLKKSHEGTGYGCVFEEVMNITKSAGYNPSGENKPVDIGVNGFRCYTCGKDSAARYDCKNDPCQLHPPLEDDEAQKWNGWGTQLKPAHEPIALARKPIKGSIKDNVLKHGVGALNIDATRVEVEADELESFQKNWDRDNAGMGEYQKLDGSVGHGADQLKDMKKDIREYVPQGRFPSNVIGEIADEYQKYFYCPKVSRRERHIEEQVDNNHPTVKPIELMKYLIKLVTPKSGIVLDPFNGSGSTGCAAVELGCEYVGIELDLKYVEIATKRIEAWNKEDTSYNEIFE